MTNSEEIVAWLNYQNETNNTNVKVKSFSDLSQEAYEVVKLLVTKFLYESPGQITGDGPENYEISHFENLVISVEALNLVKDAEAVATEIYLKAPIRKRGVSVSNKWLGLLYVDSFPGIEFPDIFPGLTEEETKASLARIKAAVYKVNFGVEEDNQKMTLAMQISALGQAARLKVKMPIRQPLKSVTLLSRNPLISNLGDYITKTIMDEVNVKSVICGNADFENYVTYSVKPDFTKLGKKLGKQMPFFQKELKEFSKNPKLINPIVKAVDAKESQIKVGDVIVSWDELEVIISPATGYVSESNGQVVLLLDVTLTKDLELEGICRDFGGAIQDYRKQLNLSFNDKIEVWVKSSDPTFIEMLEKFSIMLSERIQAVSIKLGEGPSDSVVVKDFWKENLTLYLKVSSK